MHVYVAGEGERYLNLWRECFKSFVVRPIFLFIYLAAKWDRFERFSLFYVKTFQTKGIKDIALVLILPICNLNLI